jgi:hypothetical protein
MFPLKLKNSISLEKVGNTANMDLLLPMCTGIGFTIGMVIFLMSP